MNDFDAVQRTIRRGWLWTGLALIGLVVVYIRVAYFTPVEINQGPAQKIFYVHVPSAWAALVAFAGVGVLSLVYLKKRVRKYDTMAEAAAEVGMMFGVIMLTTGPIWGKAAWGAWWTWDAKLTATLFLFFLFVGYKVLRGEITDLDLRARFSAVIGVLALVLVPFIYFSVLMFRTQHPEPPVLRLGGPAMPASMVVTLVLSVVVFTVLCIGFLQLRYSLGLLREMKEAARGLSR